MAKISTMDGNKDTNFVHLFGNKEAGHLFSQAQAAMISSGTEMEKYITSLIPPEKIITLNQLRAGLTHHSKQFVIKPGRPSAGNKKGLIADYGVAYHNRFDIIELKLGTHFDTQKAPKMKDTLQAIADYITSLTGLPTAFYICAFYATDVDEIYHGLKKAFDKNAILTGFQFCQMLGVDYELVMEKALADQPDNLNYFLLEADKIKTKINANPVEYFIQRGGVPKNKKTDTRQLDLFNGD